MGEELLPGILDDITLEFITAKLSWRDFHILRSVSRTWQQAIQDHLVYESRVRSQSTETLAIVAQNCAPSVPLSLELSLYSLREDTWSRLPRNPHLPEGIPRYSQCVSLDGKLYVMGGTREYVRNYLNHKINVGSAKVYILDLAGQRQWQECADMREPRQKFGCGVIDGKIYVFGGRSHGKSLCGCEVYDPKVNTWSRIKPMMSSRYNHLVFKLGQELFILGGSHSIVTQHRFNNQFNDGKLLWTNDAFSVEAYDPVKDEWRLITESFGLRRGENNKLFTADGKIYLMDYYPDSRIYLYDIDKQTWRPVRSSYRIKGLFWYLSLTDNIAVDHELLGIILGRLGMGEPFVYRLLRSKGFGTENGDIVWEVCAPSANLSKPLSVWAIQI